MPTCPAIALTAGPAEPAIFRGRELGAGTDLWHYVEEVRAGRMTQEEFDEYEAASVHGAGHCNELGTASTVAALVEALGMSLPGTAAIPAGDPARARAAEATGARAVELAREGLRPSQIVTATALDNAITLLMALGGGTNAVMHLLALAGRAGRAADPRSLRRALAPHAGARERAPVGRAPVRARPPRRRRRRAAARARAAAAHGRVDRDRPRRSARRSPGLP